MKLERRLRRLSPGERQHVIRVLVEALGSDDRVVFAYIHGSIVEGYPVRDVDVAVWLRGEVDPLEYILDSGARLEARLAMPIDLQVLNVAPVTFRYMVYTRGVPIVVKDVMRHDVETAKAILMYIDLNQLRAMGDAFTRLKGGSQARDLEGV